MHVLVIDFETSYGQPARHPGEQPYTLSSMTTEAYVRDPRFQTIGVGIRNADNTARVWLEHDQFKAWAAAQDWSQIAVVAHHAHFDGLILSHHYGVRPGFWFDTLSMANALRPQCRRKSLAKLAEYEGLGAKGDEVILAKGKRREDFTPAEWAQYGVYCLNDCDLEFGLYDRYVREFPITELRAMDITVRMFTEPCLTMNTAVLESHHASEIERKKNLIERCAADKDILMSNDKFAQILMEYGVQPPQKLSEAKTKSAQEKDPNAAPVYSWAFAKTDPGMKSLLEHEDPEVRALVEARVGVKSSQEETRAKRFVGIVSRGLWPVYLHYAKPHTWRWSGGDKANPQNLKRGGILRDAIEAPAGYKVVVSDSAQIEARLLAYVACETWLVDAFAQGRDVYSEFASDVYRRKVDRKRKEVVDGKEIFPDFIEGFVGKTGILGLGYGMGAPKAAVTLLAGAMGGPPVQFDRGLLDSMHVDYNKFINNPKWVNKMLAIPTRLPQAEMLIHCLVSQAFVDRYRGRNPAIVSFWDVCNVAIESMARGDTNHFGRNGMFVTEKDAVLLPSGHRLYYPDLSCDNRQTYSYWNGEERTKLYGALFCENLIQAASRDIVAEQLVKYVDTGRKVATTTHDEIVGLAPDHDAQQALGTLLKIMKAAPAWAPGLPLSAEGGIGQRYGDAK
jgi:hypothetical protein